MVSFPDRVTKLCAVGLDSVRVTLNSPHREYYNRYHKPKGIYLWKMEILGQQKKRDLYSINLLVFPGHARRMRWRTDELIREKNIDSHPVAKPQHDP